jgi:glutamyl endopeptidase
MSLKCSTLPVCRGAAVIVVLALALVGAAAGQSGRDPLATMVRSDGLTGEAMVAPSEAQVVEPFSGTGVLTPEVLAESNRGAIPSAAELRALRPAGAKIGIETVLGVDTRMRTYTTTYPNRATVLITFTGGWCTGWFYGPNVVATAGHCVHTGGPGGSWRTNVRVWPGYNAGSAPYGSYAAKWLASVVGWTGSSNEQYDYGVVKLSTNVGSTVGWYGYWWQTASLDGTPSIILGYPGDKSPTQSQWVGVDRVRVTQTNQVFYKTDTFGGQSGSAVWEDRPSGSLYCANGPCAYAIHAYGLHGAVPHSDHNHGTRITQSVYNNLVTWSNAP